MRRLRQGLGQRLRQGLRQGLGQGLMQGLGPGQGQGLGGCVGCMGCVCCFRSGMVVVEVVGVMLCGYGGGMGVKLMCVCFLWW